MALMNMDKLSGNKPKAQTSAEVPAASTESVETEYYASREAGQANIEHIPLDRIDLDPLNPRTKGMFDHRPLLAVIPRFLIINPKYKGYDAEKVRVFDEQMAQVVETLCAGDPKNGQKWRIFFEDLLPLRDNIRLLGVIQSIGVRRIGKRCQTIYGHRRYLGSILAGERNIPAGVKAEGTEGAKHTQASENLHQEELTLPQKLEQINQALHECGLTPSASPTQAASILGMDRTNIGRYLRILDKGSPALREAINAGVIRRLTSAVEYVELSDDELQETLATKEFGLSAIKKKKRKVINKEGRGAPRKFITTPKITSTRLVQKVIEKFMGAQRDINWEDKNKVNEIWITFIEKLDRECLTSVE